MTSISLSNLSNVSKWQCIVTEGENSVEIGLAATVTLSQSICSLQTVMAVFLTGADICCGVSV